LRSIINVRSKGADPKGNRVSTFGFQRAIDSLGVSGGIVFIPAGVYLLEQLQLPSYVQLVGSGKGTVLKMKDNNNKPLLVLKSDTSQMVHLRDFMIDGNKANQTSSRAKGIEFINTIDAQKMNNASLVNEHDARHFIENIYISGTKGGGLHIEGRGESQIKGLQVLRSDGSGIHSNAQDNWFTDCSVGGSGFQGFFIGRNAVNTRYVNCKSWFSGRLDADQGDGFSINANRVSLTGSEAQDNSKHGFAFLGSDIVGSGLLAEANGWQFSTNKQRTDGTGFLFYGASNCNVQGVATDRFATSQEKSHQTYAVQLLNESKGNLIYLTSKGMKNGVIPTGQLDNKNQVMIVETREDGTINKIKN